MQVASALEALPYVALIGLFTSVAAALLMVMNVRFGNKEVKQSPIDALRVLSENVSSDLGQIEMLFIQASSGLDAKRAISVSRELLDVLDEVDRQIGVTSWKFDTVRAQALKNDKISFGKMVARVEIDVGLLEKRSQQLRGRIVEFLDEGEKHLNVRENPAHA